MKPSVLFTNLLLGFCVVTVSVFSGTYSYATIRLSDLTDDDLLKCLNISGGDITKYSNRILTNDEKKDIRFEILFKFKIIIERVNKNSQLYSTQEEMNKAVKKQLLSTFYEYREFYNIPDEIFDRDEPWKFSKFQNFILYNQSITSKDHSIRIGIFLNQYARTFINENTEWVCPFLVNMTEDEFVQRFKERNHIDDTMTVADILAADPQLGVISKKIPEAQKSSFDKFKTGIKNKIRNIIE